jgi:hypothetical protein
MNLSRFQKLLDTYGNDLGAWPVSQLAAARQLIATSPEARRCLDRFAGFESALELGWNSPAVEAAASRVISCALARIEAIERLEIAPVELAASHRLLPVWLQAGTCSVAAMIIFLIGATCGMTPGVSAEKTDKASVQSLIIDGPYRTYASLE